MNISNITENAANLLNDSLGAPIDAAKLAGELILRSVGEDLKREGLLRTPQRFSKAIKEVCSGYMLTPADAVGEGIFPGEGKGLVSIRDIEFFSLCEHHMLPFWGTVSVAYFPNDKIVGLSKIPRLVDVFAKRLQVQERLTQQVADSLFQLINARAVLVKVTGSHMCMMMRGVKKNNSETVTEFSIGLDNLTNDEKARFWKSID
ncbi:MAG: GTP cyclohydrolase I FolE [Bacteriovoracaceae bacterium]